MIIPCTLSDETKLVLFSDVNGLLKSGWILFQIGESFRKHTMVFGEVAAQSVANCITYRLRRSENNSFKSLDYTLPLHILPYSFSPFEDVPDGVQSIIETQSKREKDDYITKGAVLLKEIDKSSGVGKVYSIGLYEKW